MKNIFSFWEKVEWYNTLVLNEREVRAWSWILFLFALPIFLISCSNNYFVFTKIFITIFMIDFFIRLFINPKFSPSLILWRIFVSNQKPEYVWAPQKKFAWWLWFFMAIITFLTMVVFNLFLSLNVILCVLCLIFLFFESSFWICIWCKMYNFFNKQKAENCPGWVCTLTKKEEIQKISALQIIIAIVSIILIFLISNLSIFQKEIVNLNIKSDNQNTLNQEINGSSCTILDSIK